MQSVTLKVEGMSCDHCVNAIEGALKALNGKANVNLAQKTVQVEFNETELSLASIREAIENQGYEVR
jgi:copper chaperone